MIVKLNDKPYELMEGTTLDSFVKNLDIQIQGIAVAINNEVVPKKKWIETTLTEGMKLMLIHAVSGG